MTLQQIQYAFEIAHHQSINKAAQSLFVSQPTLSQSVRELEEELGAKLFDRSRKGVSLTADGIEFLRISKDILQQMDYLKEHYAGKNSAQITRFQVSSQHYSFVIEAFIKFMKACDDRPYQLHIKETQTQTTIEDVFTRRSAVGILFVTPRNQGFIAQILEGKALEFHPCGKFFPHVFLNILHPLANQPYINLEDLKPYPAIVYEQHGEESLAEEFVTISEPKQTVVAHDRGTLLNILCNTNAYNIGTGCLIPGITPETIAAVPLAGNRETMEIGWIYPKNKQPTELVELFVDLLTETLATCCTCPDCSK